MLDKYRYGFIGAGNMAEAILKGMLETAGLLKVSVSDPSVERLDIFRNQYGVDGISKANIDVAVNSDVIILAVKPFYIKDVLNEISPAAADKLIVSIAAGVTIDDIESTLNLGARVIRVMPNTPSLVGEGASAVCRGTNATDEDVLLVTELMKTVGLCIEVDESKIDAVTGLSGSGPAYVYTFIDALTDAGVMLGLQRNDAMNLAAQTVYGSAKMVLETGMIPAQLKNNVTTPGGTTIAGLYSLEKGSFRATVISAVEASAKRAEEMSKK